MMYPLDIASTIGWCIGTINRSPLLGKCAFIDLKRRRSSHPQVSRYGARTAACLQNITNKAQRSMSAFEYYLPSSHSVNTHLGSQLLRRIVNIMSHGAELYIGFGTLRYLRMSVTLAGLSKEKTGDPSGSRSFGSLDAVLHCPLLPVLRIFQLVITMLLENLSKRAYWLHI